MGGRGAVVAAGVIAGAAFVAFAPACIDLFHSTDFEDLCSLDARAPGCPMADVAANDAGADVDAAPTNFCTWTSATARTNATHACAWLGACTAPFDENAFGQCMIDAILAYDCNTNPNLVIAPGPLHDYWDALWQAKTCDDVIAVVNPETIACSATGFACAGKTSPSVRFECVNNKGGPENCVVEGRLCATDGCEAPDAAASCDASTCEGTVFHDCEDGTDLGYDCKYFGDGTCTPLDGGAACEPFEPVVCGSSCFATNAVTCADGGATACPAGELVTIDCNGLTGGSSCMPGTPTPVWNVAAQCQGKASCTPGCDTDTLIGCAQGAKFTVSCSGEKLGPCHSVPLPESPMGYACSPPK
jgi:hypothetical protein